MTAVDEPRPAQAHGPVSHRVRRGDVELHVATWGEGAPVLLLHGFPDSHRLWSGVAPLLAAAGHRAIAVDQRGFGRSSAPAGRRSYRIDAIVADATVVLDALGVDGPLPVIGHDWGALISWCLCLAHPERVSRHVAVSVGHPCSYRSAGLEQKRKGAYVGGFQLAGLAERVLARDDFAVMRRWADDHPDPDSYVRDMSRPGRLTAGLNWYRANLAAIFTRRWGRCSVPTLGVHSAADKYLSKRQMIGSAAYMDAPWQYREVASRGHWIPLDAPDALAAHAIDWIDGAAP